MKHWLFTYWYFTFFSLSLFTCMIMVSTQDTNLKLDIRLYNCVCISLILLVISEKITGAKFTDERGPFLVISTH